MQDRKIFYIILNVKSEFERTSSVVVEIGKMADGCDSLSLQVGFNNYFLTLEFK